MGGYAWLWLIAAVGRHWHAGLWLIAAVGRHGHAGLWLVAAVGRRGHADQARRGRMRGADGAGPLPNPFGAPPTWCPPAAGQGGLGRPDVGHPATTTVVAVVVNVDAPARDRFRHPPLVPTRA